MLSRECGNEPSKIPLNLGCFTSVTKFLIPCHYEHQQVDSSGQITILHWNDGVDCGCMSELMLVLAHTMPVVASCGHLFFFGPHFLRRCFRLRPPAPMD